MLCFIAASVLLLVGVGVICRAFFIEQSLVLTVVGGVANVLVWPSLAMGQRIRKENIAIRMLELPLGMAKTEEAAADTLRDFFSSMFVSKER